jgi:hypothetical protein
MDHMSSVRRKPSKHEEIEVMLRELSVERPQRLARGGDEVFDSVVKGTEMLTQ